MNQTEAEALRARLAEYDAQGGNGGWGRRPESGAGSDCIGLNIPIKVDLGNGCSIRCYLTLPGEAAASQEALMLALAGLRDKGMPLDVFERREGWGRGGDRGGYGGRGGGGWGRRGW